MWITVETSDSEGNRSTRKKKSKKESLKAKVGQDRKKHQQTQFTHYRRPLNPRRFCGLDAGNLNSEFKNPSANLARTLFSITFDH